MANDLIETPLSDKIEQIVSNPEKIIENLMELKEEAKSLERRLNSAWLQIKELEGVQDTLNREATKLRNKAAEVEKRSIELNQDQNELRKAELALQKREGVAEGFERCVTLLLANRQIRENFNKTLVVPGHDGGTTGMGMSGSTHQAYDTKETEER